MTGHWRNSAFPIRYFAVKSALYKNEGTPFFTMFSVASSVILGIVNAVSVFVWPSQHDEL